MYVIGFIGEITGAIRANVCELDNGRVINRQAQRSLIYIYIYIHVSVIKKISVLWKLLDCVNIIAYMSSAYGVFGKGGWRLHVGWFAAALFIKKNRMEPCHARG